MRKMVFVLLIAAPALFGFTALAAADNTTYTLDCGSTTYTVVKPNESSATYTDGTTRFITAIGAIKTDGKAQQAAVPCTINGFGPIPFLITPIH